MKKLEAAFLAVAFVVLCSWHLGACATAGNPCIGTAAQRQTMPCTCPGTLDPACYPFPQDAKKKRNVKKPEGGIGQ